MSSAKRGASPSETDAVKRKKVQASNGQSPTETEEAEWEAFLALTAVTEQEGVENNKASIEIASGEEDDDEEDMESLSELAGLFDAEELTIMRRVENIEARKAYLEKLRSERLLEDNRAKIPEEAANDVGIDNRISVGCQHGTGSGKDEKHRGDKTSEEEEDDEEDDDDDDDMDWRSRKAL